MSLCQCEEDTLEADNNINNGYRAIFSCSVISIYNILRLICLDIGVWCGHICGGNRLSKQKYVWLNDWLLNSWLRFHFIKSHLAWWFMWIYEYRFLNLSIFLVPSDFRFWCKFRGINTTWTLQLFLHCIILTLLPPCPHTSISTNIPKRQATAPTSHAIIMFIIIFDTW